MSLIKAKDASRPALKEMRGEGGTRTPAPSISLLLYSYAIWFTGFCFVFPLHYLNSTAGAGELCISHYMFHNTFLSLLFCVWMIVPGEIITSHLFTKSTFQIIRIKLTIECVFFLNSPKKILLIINRTLLLLLLLLMLSKILAS